MAGIAVNKIIFVDIFTSRKEPQPFKQENPRIDENIGLRLIGDLTANAT
jgi:hypothetical protein